MRADPCEIPRFVGFRDLGFADCGPEQSVFTAAALSVSRSGKTVHEQYCGSLGFPVTASVGPDSLFDLASLTKILAVTPAWMLMERREPGTIDCSISRWFTDIPPDKSGITPRHLLAHCSGLPAWRPYYLHGSNTRSEMLDRIFSESLEYTTGSLSVYSDLGFMLLAFILEKQYGQDFNAFVAENLYEPTGLNDDLVFLPGANNRRAVWTRYSDPPGLVHDLNARSLGGVSGHAGLFGTLRGVTSLASEFLHSLKTTEGLFRREIIHRFCQPAGLVEGSSRALGFLTLLLPKARPVERSFLVSASVIRVLQESRCGLIFQEKSLAYSSRTGFSWENPTSGSNCSVPSFTIQLLKCWNDDHIRLCTTTFLNSKKSL